MVGFFAGKGIAAGYRFLRNAMSVRADDGVYYGLGMAFYAGE